MTGETAMRKVVLYQLLSLDGVAEEPSDWMSDGGRGALREPRSRHRDAGRHPPRPWHVRLLGRLLAVVGRRAVRDVRQHDAEARLHLVAPHRGVGEHGRRRPAARRVRHRPETGGRGRHRHPREHRAGTVAALGRPRRRAPAGRRAGPRALGTQALRRDRRGRHADARAARQQAHEGRLAAPRLPRRVS